MLIIQGPPEFSLSAIERDSPLWLKISAHLKDRLASLREKNDGWLGPDETARVRGKIEFIKELLQAESPLDLTRYDQ